MPIFQIAPIFHSFTHVFALFPTIIFVSLGGFIYRGIRRA